MIPAGFEFLAPWTALDRERAEALTARLQSGLSAGHVLHGIKFRALASRMDRDDVLCEDDGSTQLAVVHMTWRAETNPLWPSTRLFRDWDHWATEDMHPSHREFECG